MEWGWSSARALLPFCLFWGLCLSNCLGWSLLHLSTAAMQGSSTIEKQFLCGEEMSRRKGVILKSFSGYAELKFCPLGSGHNLPPPHQMTSLGFVTQDGLLSTVPFWPKKPMGCHLACTVAPTNRGGAKNGWRRARQCAFWREIRQKGEPCSQNEEGKSNKVCKLFIEILLNNIM